MFTDFPAWDSKQINSYFCRMEHKWIARYKGQERVPKSPPPPPKITPNQRACLFISLQHAFHDQTTAIR